MTPAVTAGSADPRTARTRAKLRAALLAATVLVESRAAEPVIPLRIVTERTTALVIVGSVAVGVALFGSSVFLGQYFQTARGYTPTEAGLLSLPQVLGSLVATVVSGQLITRYARRMTIEQRLAEIIRAFHADALSSAVNLNVDLDIMLCVLAQALLAASDAEAPEPRLWSRIGDEAAAVLATEEALWPALAG